MNSSDEESEINKKIPNDEDELTSEEESPSEESSNEESESESESSVEV